jgi:hypothetical protein
MNDLHILDWSGSKRDVPFVGWNKTHTSCFIYDEQHARRAVNLVLPNLFDVQFRENPFPNLPPTGILRAALHLPPCCASKAETDALQTTDSSEYLAALEFFPWKLATRHVMYLQPEHDKALSRLLHKELAQRRRKYEAREREIAAMPPEQAEAERRILKGEFSVADPDFSTADLNKRKFISVFDVKLGMVKQGTGVLRELRDKLLVAAWAEKFGLDLDRVATDALAFRQWLTCERAFNKRERIFDSTTGTLERSVGLHLDETQWEILEAAVSYEIRFADSSRCWLDAIEERPLADAAEVAEFEVVQKAQAPASPPPWHSEGFGTIWRRNAQGEVSESLPLSNEFRALCQLLAERDDQTAQFSEIEPQIGTRTHQLDTEAGQSAKASSKGERRVRDLLRTETGRRLLDWGALTEIEVGREKFLKLSPPKAAE